MFLLRIDISGNIKSDHQFSTCILLYIDIYSYLEQGKERADWKPNDWLG